MADQTKPYRLKTGVGNHYHEGQRVDPGTVLQLTERQADAFRQKFESADGNGFEARGDVAGTNNTPGATDPVGDPGQNPELGQQESSAAVKAVGNIDKPGTPKDESGKATESAGKKQ
jgi:hypothetical protein